MDLRIFVLHSEGGDFGDYCSAMFKEDGHYHLPSCVIGKTTSKFHVFVFQFHLA